MMPPEADLQPLRRAALEIFSCVLKEVDAGSALRRRVRRDGPHLTIFDTKYELKPGGAPLYAVAIGKAAHSMAAALDEILGSHLTEGVVAAPSGAATRASALSSRWKVFAGGHPLPNEASLKAAQASIALLRRAETERALMLFLISGGGSAAFEWPRDERVTLEDLRAANRVLVTCGATIAEINSVRRALSAVKGGGLAALAPHARQISLIVSDTNPGEEWTVASGPTLAPPLDAPGPEDVITRYRLATSLPPSILRAVKEAKAAQETALSEAAIERHLLLDNRSALEAASRVARAHGFAVEVAYDIIEQPIDEGCAALLSRLYKGVAKHKEEAFCLISGGEFSCPVRGEGVGGRNAETVLRLALDLEARRRQPEPGAEFRHAVILSAGTDGIDGNSPAAGAIADEATIERARALGLDARRSLEQSSDAFTFFQALGDAILIGPTGTNVRDLRVMIAQ